MGRLAAAALVLCLAFLSLSAAEARANEPEVLTCATVKCKAGYRCVIKRGKPQCLPPKRVCNLACVQGKVCVVKAGKPTCVDDYNPCAATTCPFGNTCTYEAGDQQGTCISVCASVRCKKGKVCIVTPKKGKPACVRMPASANPCAVTLCPTGTFCTFEAGDDHGTCVSNCAAVRCASGTCVTDKKGKPACVEEPTGYNPCAATTCPVGTSCTFQEGDQQAACVSNCAPVLCKPGLKCVTNERGNPVCKKPRA